MALGRRFCGGVVVVVFCGSSSSLGVALVVLVGAVVGTIVATVTGLAAAAAVAVVDLLLQ